MNMNNVIKLGLFVTVFFVANVSAQQSVNQSLDADPKGVVRIEHVAGEAKIIGWDNAQVKVEGELGEDTEEFTFKRDGDSIDIIVEVESKSGWGGWGKGKVADDDLTIYVPKASLVRYESVNARVSVKGVLGGADLEVVNGSIVAKDLAGKVTLESVNGNIILNNMSGELQVESVNGSIDIEAVSGSEIQASAVNGNISIVASVSELQADTVNGNIELALQEVRYIVTETVNGDIEMAMRLAPSAELTASSVGGNITLSLPADVAAKFEIESFAGGSIRNSLTDDKPQKAEYGPRRWLDMSTANPSASVEIDTVNGSIRLLKQ
jgi:DUF4097 and DUF4098 domain-containing protein YvlB